MAVGIQPSAAQINQQLGTIAISLRNDLQGAQNFYLWVSGLGVSGLEAIGFNAADAANIISLAGYMNNIASIYNGTATQATTSNFDAALSVLWGGQ